jgi:hypothetical protein
MQLKQLGESRRVPDAAVQNMHRSLDASQNIVCQPDVVDF